jgi:hypothetical protein
MNSEKSTTNPSNQGSEKTSSTNLSSLTRGEKTYSMQSFVNKLNRYEPNTFGNYFVDFSDMFPDQNEIHK